MGSQSLDPKLVALGFALVAAPFVILFYLSIGPLGWTALGGSVVVIGVVVTVRESAEFDPANRLERTNCENCGARIDADADACEYCGADR
ncbi:hypothetical protein [Natrinema caseinilyticum]|uniref:hypothetical protein n=1 Tax=Natrinema caseinilyticum TaxID=2961570 RepID=UPI0020C59D3C|nr:hypothetical protein [Natrinema caseinilyticum]